MIKNYHEDFTFFVKKLETNTPFSLARFNDGEVSILLNATYYCYDFQFDPDHKDDCNDTEQFRVELKEALQWQHPSYYVGIICPHCFGVPIFEKLKTLSNQKTSQLTWATLFVNNNYLAFLGKVLPLLQNKKNIYILCNNKSKLERLPFKVKKRFNVPRNAWKLNTEEALKEVKEYLLKEEKERMIFLIAAGPSAAIYVKELCALNPLHTYIDIGSVLDPILFPKRHSRIYQMGGVFTPCEWHDNEA